MSYITNIDTLSALLDRLISENIKLHFFRKDGIVDNIEHQEKVISEIKHRISQLLTDVYENKKYDYISELRTYKPDDIVETLEELIHNDITTGEGDRANLKEANENRAVSKNKLDEQFKDFIGKKRK
jgi:t-SNARE complex subunit (syntaxin)